MALPRDPSIEPRDLRDRVAVVTGASRGIGFAIAQALAKRGVRLALVGRDARSIEAVANELGDLVLPLAVDITDPAAVRDGFAQAVDRFGRLDILVNNAGMASLHRIENSTDRDLEHQVATNFLGLVYCCREAIPHLRAAGGGDIVNVSSTSVANPYPYLSIYAATKAAVETFSLALRRELRADGTRVIVVRLGPSWTNFNAAWDPDVSARAFKEWIDGGFPGWDGSMDPAITGETVAAALAYPSQAGVDFVEINPTAKAPMAPPVRS
jgi:NAD(P)-dependent dehydrogenase (short-subunit alcohol dehydrogenase family)